ncbi:Hypoxia-inducible factor 1-alpha inhibitor (Hypoxia-inducible factor asparagine hydroxylase) [Durusdinium trenchii]|uniref:Hypoxia-inducible factor 1-alpha inhibitor (Hypoxia-inducible factor asparagine hydroxylase) n=1 Tax=Durusdinium trenchii TaxID=1381693 RepID=A0ABP0SIA3_9DINO
MSARARLTAIAATFASWCVVSCSAESAESFGAAGVPWWGFLDEEVAEGQGLDDVAAGLAERRAVVVRNGAADWPALSKWKDVDYLESRVGGINTVRSEDPVNVYFSGDRALARHDWNDEENAKAFYRTIHKKDTTNMSIPALVAAIERTPQTGLFHYGTADFKGTCLRKQNGASSLCEDDMPGYENLLWLDDPFVIKKADDSKDSDLYKLHLWVGKEGTTTGLHYDVFHNMHVQITGHKRFLLVDADYWDKVYLFPYTHPHSRHSQLDVAEMNVKGAFPDLETKKIPFKFVDLGPGDMLYIPPNMLHRVLPVGKELSISVNGWHASTEAIFATYLRHLHVQSLESDQVPPLLKGVMIRALLLHAIMHIDGVLEESAIDKLHLLFSQRFGSVPLLKALDCTKADWTARPCPGGEELLQGTPQYKEISHLYNLLNDAFSKAKQISKIRRTALDLLLADYAEVLTHQTFGYPDTCHYLRCFAYYDMWSCPVEMAPDPEFQS